MTTSPAPPSLTPRQRDLLDFLHREQALHGVMPSSREIQRHFGFASQTAAMDLLRALERKGFIRRLAGKARAVILLKTKHGTATPSSAAQPAKPLLTVPILGTIAAGMPQDAIPESARNVMIDAASFGLSRNAKSFALEVRGDSMKDAHIVEGDIVIMEMREPRAGDVVAAVIDGECTLKRFLTQSGSPYLKAENAAYPDLIPARELLVQGVMVGLMRSPVGAAAAGGG